MSKINIREFRRKHEELLKNKLMKQDYVDDLLRDYKRRIRFWNLSDRLPNSCESANLFTDPTLFALLRDHKEARYERRKMQSRIREMDGGDQLVKRRPQAKDVLPHRTLDAEDEQRVLSSFHASSTQKSQNPNQPRMYPNPLVPKKRKYLAESKVPTLFRQMYGESGSGSSTARETSADTPSICGSDTAEANPLNMDEKESIETLIVRYLYPELATETAAESSASPEDSIQDDLEDPDDEESEEYEDLRQVDSLEISAMSHPDIPQTELSRKFLKLVKHLDESPLHTVNDDHVINLMNRQREYACYQQKETPKQEDEKKKLWNFSKGSTRGSPISEAILSIAIYNPRKSTMRIQEIEVLGSQSLADLRDALYCFKDFVQNRDHKNEDPNGVLLNTREKKLSGSCFFFENIFYVDTRAEEQGMGSEPDYSEPIRKWVAENGRHTQENLALYEKAKMQETKFEDLELRLDHPYLFIHQNGCQHLVMVRDIRIYERCRDGKQNIFPRTFYNQQHIRHKCTMCLTLPAVYITVDDVLSGTVPAYLCKECYVPLHFDKDGNQVNPFQVAAYLG